MDALVALDTFKRHLRLHGTDEDPTLAQQLEAAQGLIVAYIARPSDTEWSATIATWTADNAPAPIRQAILLQAGELHGYRGDSDGPKREIGDLSPTIKALLRPYRLPVMA